MSDDQSTEFFDALVRLVTREIEAARQSGDNGRLADVVTDLGDVLGKAVAIACEGSPSGIDTLLTGLDGLIAKSGSDVAAVFCVIADMKGKEQGL